MERFTRLQRKNTPHVSTYLAPFTANVAALLIASALLAGCASGGYQVAPSGPSPQSGQSRLDTSIVSAKPFSSPLGGEVFAASNVTVRYLGDYRGTKKTKFHASGMARGPYPGTFVASGVWKQFFLHGRWDFSESFTITSQARTIKGSLGGYGVFGDVPYSDTTFGPVAKSGWLQYYSWIDGIHYSGPVTTNKIEAGSLQEMLRR